MRRPSCSSGWRPTGACSTSSPPRTARAFTGPSPGSRSPSAARRRKRARQADRERKRERIRREEAVLDDDGHPHPAAPARGDARRTCFRRRASSDERASTGRGRRPAQPWRDRHCYVCKDGYSRIHHFYDQLCPACADFNFAARTELADLRGRVALLTGGRVKIGYQAGLKLLRSGAHLIVTTRFPRNAAARYAAEPDFADWGHRLEIVGLDLRHTPSVEAFCRDLVATRDRLDFIINNACQTVRRPPEFYAHMMAAEAGGASRDAGARPPAPP